ncbi:uncharacterized protein MYCFIDRAFT_169615 [Pseudocercospora fijiensis CIRAD86]|uniref:Uncharacterized protein n=1 Tax=Pseudocercospora fijiensis (strain CIRAD86) TaxID=383855 RepID=N1QAD2_PSEFD|nr:uncharacterized protein MYCFIDRAFT_169615 [Pseudocercospora fijiensis CIRAD86]EME87883.1 hypothetical protein MYCFIDRAFT_169615 [Pseudocercospora fijiensis CIRAD86]
MFQVCEQIILTQQASQKEPDQEYPAEYASALRTLDAVLAAFFDELLSKSRRLAMHLGLFDAHFDFGLCGYDIPSATRKSDKDPVFNALNAMYGHNREDCDLPGHFIHQAQSYPDRLPLKLSECLSDMAAVDEAVMSIRCFRPSFGEADVATIPTIAAKHQDCKHWRTVAYDDHVTENINNYRPQLSRKLEALIKVPCVDSKITSRSVTNFDASHEKLGAFWSEYRKVRSTLLQEKQCPEDLLPEAMDTLRFALSKEYINSRESERRQIIAAAREKEDVSRRRQTSTPSKRLVPQHAANEPCQTVWGSEDTQETPRSRLQMKEKVKTRPDVPILPLPRTEDPPQNEGENDVADEQAEDRLHVSSHTMDIVHRMFVTYGKRMAGSVRWNVFVAAMEDAGLAAEHDNGGSEVTFRDIKRGKGSIVFHAPHPDPRINPICMRAYGKRLQRQLGWSYDLFTCHKCINLHASSGSIPSSHSVLCMIEWLSSYSTLAEDTDRATNLPIIKIYQGSIERDKCIYEVNAGDRTFVLTRWRPGTLSVRYGPNPTVLRVRASPPRLHSRFFNRRINHASKYPSNREGGSRDEQSINQASIDYHDAPRVEKETNRADKLGSTYWITRDLSSSTPPVSRCATVLTRLSFGAVVADKLESISVLGSWGRVLSACPRDWYTIVLWSLEEDAFAAMMIG